MSQEKVSKTASNAMCCKWSAVQAGYWEDPFLDWFTPPEEMRRQSPFINRAYYARAAVLKALLTTFFSSCKSSNERVQFLNLGCGLDTQALRLLAEHKDTNLHVYEVDLEDIVAVKKTHLKNLKQSKKMQNLLCFKELSKYHIFAGDLSNFENVVIDLQLAGFDFSCLTVVLVECVMTYLSSEAIEQLMMGLGSRLWQGCIFTYERIGVKGEAINDHISETLLNRGIELRSLQKFSHCNDWTDLLRHSGWTHSFSWDMNKALMQCIPSKDLDRIAVLEPFDEYASLKVFQSQYCVSVGTTIGLGPFKSTSFETKCSDIRLRFLRLECSLNTITERLNVLEKKWIPPQCSPKLDYVVIREFEEKDTTQVREIIKESMLEQGEHPSIKKFVKKMITKQLQDIRRDFLGTNNAKGRLWVAEYLGGEVIGCVGLQTKQSYNSDKAHFTGKMGDNMVELKHLAVKPFYRRVGVATKLVNTLEDYCHANKMESIVLFSLEIMEGAKSFYKKLKYDVCLDDHDSNHTKKDLTHKPSQHKGSNMPLKIISYMKSISS